MSNWRYKIDISEPWKKFENDEISIEEMKKAVVEILKNYLKYIREEEHKEELLEIAGQFESVDDNIEEFDGVMDELYNWGDTVIKHRLGDIKGISSKLAWIKTKF